MIGTDSNALAVAYAKENLELNPHLSTKLQIRHQHNNSWLFKGMMHEEEYFDFTMCNPPFFSSEAQAVKANTSKNTNLGIDQTERNFGGQATELWCNGGEALFVKRMIKESVLVKQQVGLFSSLISSGSHLPKQQKLLQKIGASHKVIAMKHGQKQSHLLFWHFSA